MNAPAPGPDRDRELARDELDRLKQAREPGAGCTGCLAVALASVMAAILLGALTTAPPIG